MSSPDMLKLSDKVFVADDMLGRLAKWLRILGCNVKYFHSIDDCELIRIADDEGRILLTRDNSLVEKSSANTILITSDNYREQLREVISKTNAQPSLERVFSRCLICNTTLIEIDKEKAHGMVPPFVFETVKRFVICNNCGKIYWEGTHSRAVQKTLDYIFRKVEWNGKPGY